MVEAYGKGSLDYSPEIHHIADPERLQLPEEAVEEWKKRMVARCPPLLGRKSFIRIEYKENRQLYITSMKVEALDQCKR